MSSWQPTQWMHPEDMRNASPVTVNAKLNRYHVTKFSVTYGCYVFNHRTGRWQSDPQPSNRNDAYYRDCRFDSFEQAIEVADRERQCIENWLKK